MALGPGDGAIAAFLGLPGGVIRSGGMFQNATCVLSDAFYAGGVSRVGGLDATVVGTGGLFDVAAKMIEQAAEEQAGVGGEDGVIHRIQVQFAGRPQRAGSLE